MSDGWLRIQRKLLLEGHPVFKPEPATETQAWLWMLAMARHSGGRHRVGNQIIDVPRGSFVTTLRDFQHKMLWSSDKKVRGFLSRLENERMIGRTVVGTRNAPGTHVTICNYELYQSDGRTGDARRTHDGRTDGRTEDAVKNKETRLGGGGGTRAREIEAPDLTFRERLIEAIWPDNSNINKAIALSSQADAALIQNWRDNLQLTDDELIGLASEISRTSTREIGSINFFKTSLPREAGKLIAARSEKVAPLMPPKGSPNDQSADHVHQRAHSRGGAYDAAQGAKLQAIANAARKFASD